MQDRQRQGSSRDLIQTFDIPPEIETLESLVTLFRSGVGSDPTYNNNVEDGGATVSGTPINKETLLSTETAEEILGEDSPDATVDKALMQINQNLKAVVDDVLQDILQEMESLKLPIGARFYTDKLNGYPKYGTWTLTEQGQFGVGFSGTAPYTAGATGGSKDSVVIDHDHQTINSTVTIQPPTNVAKTSGSGWLYQNTGTRYDYLNLILPNVRTGRAGYTGTDRNLPPYKVLYVYKRTA